MATSFVLIFHFENSHYINIILVFKAKTKNKIINPKTSIYLFTFPKEVLRGISQLDLPELEKFMSQASTLIARKKAPSLSKKEAELLLKINRELPAKIHKRYGVLSEKLRAETISKIEHKELLDLIETIEKRDTERLQCLIELAQIREVSLDQLMKELGLTRPI